MSVDQIISDEEYAKRLQQQIQDEEYARQLQQSLQNNNNKRRNIQYNNTINTDYEDYNQVINKVVRMPSDHTSRSIAGRYGLNITNVSWEDNARSQNSSWGPCISDMTLQVEGKNLPVIRSPNYEDLTWDVPMEKIPLIVGNEHDETLRKIDLKTYLQNFKWNLHDPTSWKGENISLYDPSRDSNVIMSAQACFLPVPKLGGESKFNVAIFNYQSCPGSPAVLAIVANSQGTSAQIVDTSHIGSGQKLYFNKNGKRCSFLGERLSQHRIEKGEEHKLGQPMSSEEKQQNMLLIIQVPLKIRVAPTLMSNCSLVQACCDESYSPGLHKRSVRMEKADVEDAIIKIGVEEGPFREVGGLAIVRDPSYPVRVTLQYYKATSNGIADESHMAAISNQIKESRKFAVAVGSLVVGGNTGRTTEHAGKNIPPWWDEFWLMYKSVYPQYKSSQEASSVVFKNGRFCGSSLNDCQSQVLTILGSNTLKSDNNLAPSWDIF